VDKRDAGGSHVQQKRRKRLRGGFPHGGDDLIRDKVIKSVEDEDAEELDSEVICPFRVEKCVFFGGCFLCMIEVSTWN